MSLKEEVILDLVDSDLPFACISSRGADLPELTENQIQEIEKRADRWYAGLM